MSKVKILLLDIETAPMLGYVWGIWDQTVGLNQIKTDWHILSWSAKWLDEPASKIMYQDQRNSKNIENDRKLLEGIWKLLDEADVIITQNGKRFDIKKLNARFILNGIQPPSPFQHIDTHQIAKKHFAFTSNRLEYMTDKLCTKYKKIKTKKFSGFELWRQCLSGNKEAWAEMEKYNKYDVLSLEELYKKLAPWDNSVNFTVFQAGSDNIVCTCGSEKFRNKGYNYTSTGKFKRFKCLDCGKNYTSPINLLSVTNGGPGTRVLLK